MIQPGIHEKFQKEIQNIEGFVPTVDRYQYFYCLLLGPFPSLQLCSRCVLASSPLFKPAGN
jgi:hypothetical protein